MSAINPNSIIGSYEKGNVRLKSNEYLVCLPGRIVTLCHVCLVIVKGFTSPFFLRKAYLNLHCLIFLGKRWMSQVIVQLTPSSVCVYLYIYVVNEYWL